MGLSYIDEMAFFLAVDATPKYVRRRLDEILVAGHFQTVKLKDMDVYGIPWLKLVIRIITEDAVFREQVLRIIDEEVIAALEQLRSLSTQKASIGICFDEYQDLVRLNVLRDLAGDEAYDVIAKLFKVPKGVDIARLIMDAKEGNLLSKKPPSFSLMKCEEIRRRILDLGPCFFVSADLRHWFYQIDICPAFQALMTFFIKKKDKRGRDMAWQHGPPVRCCPKVLPMGHKWSPYLAQGCCWAIILLDADPTKDGFTIKVHREEMPSVVEFFYPDGRPAGFVTCYYDNVLVASKDKVFAERWAQKLLEAGLKTGGEWKIPKDGPAIAGPDTHVAFIGVQYRWQGADLLWWWPDAERAEWKEENPWTEEHHAWTPRKMYSYMGTLMWTLRIREVPFCDYAGAMNLIGVMEKFAAQQSWDYELTKEDVDRHNIDGLMRQIREEILEPHVCRRSAEAEPRRRVYIATDASTLIGLGAVWIDETRKISRVWQRRHKMDEATKCSNWVEIRAIYEAILQTADDGVVIRLASDNACAIQAILKGWSRSPEVVKYVTLIYGILRERHQKLSLVHVSGRDNIADTPSRFMTAAKAVAEKKARTETAFLEEEGRKVEATCDVLFGKTEAKWEGVNKGW